MLVQRIGKLDGKKFELPGLLVDKKSGTNSERVTPSETFNGNN